MAIQANKASNSNPVGTEQPPLSGRMRHVLSALVQNQPGVLAQVSGMFASRGFNIESLAVSETEDPQLSRIIVVVMGDDRHLEQVRKQLEKIVTVVKVQDFSRVSHVERDLMLIRVNAPREKRPELQAIVQIFRARIVDVGTDSLMIEISGQEQKIQAFIEEMRPYGIQELARTGRIALIRGGRFLDDPESLDHDDPSIARENEPVSVVQGHSEL